jgi:GNAT superfamily N-acetyltransferase
VPHQQLQEFVVIDHSKEMVIVASVKTGDKEEVVGLGQYSLSETSHTAEVAFVVRDEYQAKGIGSELLSYLTYLARRNGLLGFTAETLMENRAMLRVFEKMGYDMKKSGGGGVYELEMMFKEKQA